MAQMDVWTFKILYAYCSYYEILMITQMIRCSVVGFDFDVSEVVCR